MSKPINIVDETIKNTIIIDDDQRERPVDMGLCADLEVFESFPASTRRNLSDVSAKGYAPRRMRGCQWASIARRRRKP